MYIFKSIQSCATLANFSLNQNDIIMIMCNLYNYCIHLKSIQSCAMQTVHNVTCILLALVKPSYALLPATNQTKAVGGVCHATITDHTVDNLVTLLIIQCVSA